MSINSNKSKNNKEEFSTLCEACTEFLPELMLRNTKLGNRLKSKLKVSSLLNNIELRNQRYLKEFISSSDRTLQDLKSGLQLSKAMKISSDNLSLLNSKILNDCFIKKSNIINSTKKNLAKNTEEETNMIIKQSINKLKESISPSYKIKEEPIIENNKKKFFSESELSDAKAYINDKLLLEEKILKNKIKDYLDKVKIIKVTKNNNIYDHKIQKANREINKDFYIYAKNVSLDDHNIKMIYYKKIKPLPIRDKSCPTIKNIKKNLFPNIKEGNIKDDNYININNCNSVKIINGMKLHKKIDNKINSLTYNEEDKSLNNDNKDIVVNNKNDSYNTLKKIIIRNRSLLNKSSKKYEKLSTLIDIKLPKLSDYDLIINNKNKKLEEKNNKSNNNIHNEEEFNNSENKSNDNIKNNIKKEKKEMINNYSDLDIIKEFKALRDEINMIKLKKLEIEENKLKNKAEKINSIYFIKKIPLHKKLIFLKNKEKIFNKKFNDINRLRIPSSNSASILKRKFKIKNEIQHKHNKINKIYRNLSNESRDKTNPTTIKNTNKDSSCTSNFVTSKNENMYKQILNNININTNKKNNILTKRIIVPPIFSSKNKISKTISKNNLNSCDITSLSDI